MEQLSFNQNLAYAQAANRFVGTGASGFNGSHDTGRAPVTSSRPAQPKGNVTEIILPEGQVENFQLLLPMLTQLNQEKRWLAWIDPPQSLVSKWQTMRGIVAGELLLLRSTADYPARELAERALSAGTCHAVVMWTRKLSRNALTSLEQASAQGNSHGVVLRQR